MKQNKKILIIGAKGMLGQELVKVFKKDDDYEVIAWDREDVDVTKEKDLTKKIGEIKPAAIINSTGYNAVDEAETKEGFALAKKINGLAPGYLAKIAKKLKATLIHYSSDYVFSGEPVIPEPTGCTHHCASCGLHEGFVPEIGFEEDDKPSPISKYGKTKLMGEKEIAKNTKQFYIIRTSKLFGKPAKSEKAKRSFFDTMLEYGRKGEVRKLVDEETSCFTYAPDLAKKTKEILDSKKPFGIYHVVNSDPCTWYEAAVELYHQAKISAQGGSAKRGKTSLLIPVSGDEFPRPAKRPYYSVLINTKLNPMRSYKDALKEYLKQIK